jgi:hypothetical protein
MISPDERTNFEINGTDLLLVDLNVFCQTNANNRNMLEQLKQVFMSNNTTGASIYDLGKAIQADSIGSLNGILKDIEQKTEERRKEEMQHQEQMQQEEIKAKQAEKQMVFDHESREKEKDRRSRLLEAEIKAAGYGAMQDVNKNEQSDFQDVLKDVKQSEQYAETMNFNREKESAKNNLHQQKLDLEKQKLMNESQNKQIEFAIARENKNRFDQKKPNK